MKSTSYLQHFFQPTRVPVVRGDLLRYRSDKKTQLGTLLLALCVATVVLLPRLGLGTVEEQRARLPPPAHCDDPVQGVWRSHAFSAFWQEWGEFTLEVRRADSDPSLLYGTITLHAWFGPETEELPGPCRDRLHYIVSMDARGRINDGHIQFGGVGPWRLEELMCGRLSGYNLDNFDGQIDPGLQEFQTVNNDGGRYVNAPTVFRRIGCFEPPGPTEINVSTPAFFPGRESGDGGGCW